MDADQVIYMLKLIVKPWPDGEMGTVGKARLSYRRQNVGICLGLPNSVAPQR